MASTVRCLKGLVAKRNDAAMNWLQDSTQALMGIQAKESARRMKTCERYIELLETSLTKLTKAFDEASETTEEEKDHLDKYIKKTQATIMKLHEHRTRLEEAHEDNIGIETDGTISLAAVNRLPIIPIPTFTGKKWEWDNFWALYKANVHDQNLTQLQKFNYLLASLSGEAKQSVSRFFVSANNYDKAIQHLIRRYGNKDGIVLELNRSLHNCVAKGPSTTEQRQLWDKLSTIAAQLQEHEEQLNNQLTIQIFVQKFHARIRKAAMEKRLQHQEEHRSEWTLNQWLDAIDNVISQEEQLNHMLSVDGQFTGPPLHNTTTTKTHPDLEKNWKRGTLCECCGDKGHRWTTCPLITTAIQKRRFLFEANRCLNCGSENHRIASCWSGSCRKCYKKHHTATCTESTPQEPKSCDKSNQHAETRFTNGEIAQGTFPINETASRSSEPETAATLLLRRGHAASCLHSSSDSEATAKRTLFDDNFKERSRRQPKSSVPPQLLESNNAKPPAKKGLVTATSAIATTAISKLISSNSDSDMDAFQFYLGDHQQGVLLGKQEIRSDDEGTTMHRSWKNSNSKPRHQKVRDWMQSMNQHFEAFIREMEKEFKTFQEEIKRQHEKAHCVNIRKEHQALRRTMQSEDEAKGGHVKNCKHRRTSLTTSQRRSNTATSVKKGRSTEVRKNNALTSKETPKRKERNRITVNGQRRQVPARGKEEENQKWLKEKRTVSCTGQAGAYELHSYQSTRPSEHGGKHSNVGDKRSRHREENKQTHKRSPKNSTIDRTRRSSAWKDETWLNTRGNAPKVLSSEQIAKDATENTAYSTEFDSGIARRGRRWRHITPCAPWQGAFYESSLRCIRKSLFETLGALAMAFDGLRTTLTDMEAESSSRWRSRQQQKIRKRYGTGGLKRSLNEGIVLPRDAARPISAHSRKTNATVQIDESPQKATREAVMAHPDGPRLRRRSTQTAPLEIDNGEAFIADKQAKATLCNANQGKKQPKRSKTTSSDTEVKVNGYHDDHFTINSVAPLVC